jgi:hypothetical protein
MSTVAAATAAVTATTVSSQTKPRTPSVATLEHATKLALAEDKPILFDYWAGSLDKTVMIGVNQNKEKILVRNEDEFTSIIAQIYKVKTEYIVMTENSIYIVDVEIPTRRIS